MGWMKSWLVSVTCAAMIAALADALCPEGFPKKLTRLAGGLLLLLSVLGSLGKVDEAAVANVLAKYQVQQSGYKQAMASDEREMMKSIIAGQTAAYISHKAAALGIEEPQVWVECRMTGEGFPAPDTVQVRGSGAEEAWRALEQAITADFALPKEAQTFERMDAE